MCLVCEERFIQRIGSIVRREKAICVNGVRVLWANSGRSCVRQHTLRLELFLNNNNQLWKSYFFIIFGISNLRTFPSKYFKKPLHSFGLVQFELHIKWFVYGAKNEIGASLIWNHITNHLRGRNTQKCNPIYQPYGGCLRTYTRILTNCALPKKGKTFSCSRMSRRQWHFVGQVNARVNKANANRTRYWAAMQFVNRPVDFHRVDHHLLVADTSITRGRARAHCDAP